MNSDLGSRDILLAAGPVAGEGWAWMQGRRLAQLPYLPDSSPVS